jgi:hypothetical protein
MKLVIRSLRSLATKLHILAREADIFIFPLMVIFIVFFITNIKVGNRIHRFCLPMLFRFRKHKGHDLAYDVKTVFDGVKICFSQHVMLVFILKCE